MTTSATPGWQLLGTAAESFERFRLGYPDEVVERTLTYAGRPVTRAVEIGAGTGKAARAFASRGVHVTALESDADMFAVLRRETAGMQVHPVDRTFEEYDGPRTDLVYAAASWHWTDPRSRCRRAADLLAEGGVVAVFGSPARLAEPAVRAAVHDAGLPTLDDDAFRAGPELAACALFTDVEEHRVAREVVLPQREYVGYLSTVSDYAALPPEDRQRVLHRLTDVLPAQVRLDLTVRLDLARRA
jgi:trans-aconitate methyltransferase